jgi:hypothetical protein
MRKDTLLRLLFFGMTFACLTPILMVSYVPAVDLPNHVFHSVLHTQAGNQPRPSYFTVEWLPSPYILFSLLMYPAIKIFGYLTATKILLCIYLILLPLSILVFMQAFNPQRWYLAFLAFGLVYNYHFEYGFIQYCLGIPFVFLGFAVVKMVLEGNKSTLLIFTGCMLSALVYLSHLDNLIVYSIGAVFLFWLDPSAIGRRRNNKRVLLSQLTSVGVMLLPVVILSASYLLYIMGPSFPARLTVKSMAYDTLFHQVFGAFRLFFSFNMVIDILGLLIMSSLLVWLFIRHSTRVNRGFLFYFGLLMILLALFIPRANFFDSWDHSSRFLLYGIVALLATLVPSSNRPATLISSLMSVLLIINIIVRGAHYVDTSQLTKEYVETVSKYIPFNQKVYNLYNGFPDSSIPILLHAISYYHIEKGGYSPFLFAQQPHVAGLSSSTKLPAASEYWHQIDTTGFRQVLSHYDYLVILTCGSPLPQYFEQFEDCAVHTDSVCAIYKLEVCSLIR